MTLEKYLHSESYCLNLAILKAFMKEKKTQ